MDGAMKEPTIAVVGTGHFSSYLIAALRNGGHAGRIVLSPLSRKKAEAIARKHECEVARDDADLLAGADWILVAVRPEHLQAALVPLAVRADQVVISAAAGVPTAELRRHLGTGANVVRIMPSSYIATMADGLIPLFPAVDTVERVLGRAGKVLAFESEEHFELATAGACLSGWMYSFMESLEDWFAKKGLPPEQARLLVLGNIAGAAALATAESGRSLGEISDGIATEGTYTKTGLEILLAEGAAKPWLKALDAVFDGLA